MANQEHVEILLQGLGAWHDWRVEHPDIRPDLSRAIFSSADIEGTPLGQPAFGAFLPCTNFVQLQAPELYLVSANLSSADFSQADLRNAYLNDSNLELARLIQANLADAHLLSVNLTKANLSGADLSGADLSGADLSGADLSGADLSGADLSGATLNATYLAGVTLEHAMIGWTMFANVDLSSVQGLETIKHQGPSSVGFDTLLRSKGKLPTSFLSQAGLDQTMIEVVQQQLKQSTHLPACSLGYTLTDQVFALRLQASIQETGAPCWFVALDIPPGTPRPTAATAFIERYSLLILILSKSALESEEIQEEVQIALTMENERHKQVLFLITIDDSALFATDEWVLQLRANHPLIDFTGWQEEEYYQQALQQLFQVLRTS